MTEPTHHRSAELFAPFLRLRVLYTRLRGSHRHLLLVCGLFGTALVLAAGDRPARVTLAALEAVLAIALVRRRLRRPDGGSWEFEPGEPAGPTAAAAQPASKDAHLLAEHRATLERLGEGLEHARVGVEARGAELAEKAEALRRRSADLSAAEEEILERERTLAERAERAREAERRLAQAEKDVREAKAAAPAEGIAPEWLDRWAERLSEDDKALREKSRSVEERDAELRQREARLVADAELRLLGVERRERELAELETRLADRARELEDYVVQVQRRIGTAVAS